MKENTPLRESLLQFRERQIAGVRSREKMNGAHIDELMEFFDARGVTRPADVTWEHCVEYLALPDREQPPSMAQQRRRGAVINHLAEWLEHQGAVGLVASAQAQKGRLVPALARLALIQVTYVYYMDCVRPAGEARRVIRGIFRVMLTKRASFAAEPMTPDGWGDLVAPVAIPCNEPQLQPGDMLAAELQQIDGTYYLSAFYGAFPAAAEGILRRRGVDSILAQRQTLAAKWAVQSAETVLDETEDYGVRPPVTAGTPGESMLLEMFDPSDLRGFEHTGIFLMSKPEAVVTAQHTKLISRNPRCIPARVCLAFIRLRQDRLKDAKTLIDDAGADYAAVVKNGAARDLPSSHLFFTWRWQLILANAFHSYRKGDCAAASLEADLAELALAMADDTRKNQRDDLVRLMRVLAVALSGDVERARRLTADIVFNSDYWRGEVFLQTAKLAVAMRELQAPLTSPASLEFVLECCLANPYYPAMLAGEEMILYDFFPIAIMLRNPQILAAWQDWLFAPFGSAHTAARQRLARIWQTPGIAAGMAALPHPKLISEDTGPFLAALHDLAGETWAEVSALG